MNSVSSKDTNRKNKKIMRTILEKKKVNSIIWHAENAEKPKATPTCLGLSALKMLTFSPSPFESFFPNTIFFAQRALDPQGALGSGFQTHPELERKNVHLDCFPQLPT